MNDDDYVAFLASEARSAVSALHEYRLQHSDQKNEIHVFVEGDDDALFYLPYIRRLLSGRELYIYFCGGKWEVVSTKEFIEIDGDTNSCLFFIDRDYDDFFDKQPIPDGRTYLTDYYSIENHLVCNESLEILLSEFARISKSESSYRKIFNSWAIEFVQFSRLLRPILAWTLAMRAASRSVNLNNVDLKKVIHRDEIGWKRKQDGFLNFVKATCRREEAVSPFAVRPWLKQLKVGDEKRWLRGKFELWFFETFLLMQLKEIKASSKRRCVPTALEQRQLFHTLGGRITPPESLTVFLDSRLT